MISRKKMSKLAKNITIKFQNGIEIMIIKEKY